MESKSDVKAIMARFQAGEVTNEASSTLPGRAKPPLQSTLSTGHSVPAKKPAVESLSGGAIKKPPLKPTVKNTDTPEPTKSKPLVSKLSNPRLNSADKPENLQKTPPKPFGPQPPEAKAPAPKPSASKPPLSATQSDPRAAFSKASPSVPNRPSWVKEDTDGAETGSAPPKLPLVQLKPTSSISRLRQQGETPASKPSLPSSAPKPSSTFKEAQSTFTKEAGGAEPPEGGSKAPPPATNATPPPKPAASKKPSLKKPSPQVSSSNGAAAAAATTTTGPKRNPLVNIFALGPAPAKPNRPPTVNLEPFRRGEGSSNGPDINKPIIPAPLTSYPGNQSNHSTPSQAPPPPALPSLPPRHPGTMVQEEDFYDDIDDIGSAPPPLPPAAGHPSQRAKTKEKGDDQDDDASDKQRQAADQKVDKKQLEAEKKEQEARKKFKLFGPLETIHQGKARLDYRGSKTDLPLKQGEGLDIIRVQGNPEGKWLGRNQDGSIGYVKIASVEIDFNSLKRCNVQQLQDQELYDDVAPDISAMKARGVVLPPLPGEDGEIYDDVADPNLEVSDEDAGVSPAKPRGLLRVFEWSRRTFNDKDRVPPPSQFTTNGSSADQPAAAAAAMDEDVYDDVDSQALPPPPLHSSLPGLKFISKAADMVAKKQKKTDKEEKEFRKKFKYEGEIRVLYQVTVIPTLTNKKWASKELAVKAGEVVDVIAKAEEDKLICRSEEGKFGYVSTNIITMNDSEIYDDIGEECIYDND